MAKDKLPATPATRFLRANKISFEDCPYKYEDKGGAEVAAKELEVEEYRVIKTLVMEEVPYENELLYWMEGEQADGNTSRPILIPAQCVFLFCNLDGKRALVSAMTETPYPYPNGPASNPAPEGLPIIRFEELPDYSTGSPGQDLAILEAVLDANGYKPIYVDLTRDDIGIPVVKAIIPGLELMADFDQFSRVSPRLLRHVLKKMI